MLLRRVSFAFSTAFIAAGSLAVALGAGAGCRHDRPPPEEKIDAPSPDTPPAETPEIQPVSVLPPGADRDQPADLTCNGAPRPDAGPIFPPDADDEAGADAAEDSADGGPAPLGTLVEKEIELIAFGTGGADKLANQTVDVFYYNTFSREPDVVGAVSDSNGLFKVWLPEGLRVGYHVRSSELLGDYYGLDDLHVPVPPVKAIRWQGVTRKRQDELSLAITGEKGYVMPKGTGIIAGRVYDCSRHYMQYATVRLYDVTDNPAGVELSFVKCGTGLCMIYMNDAELPDPGRHYTSRSALFAMIDVPIDRKLVLRASGRVPDGSVIDVARRNVEVKENSITVEYLEPSNPK